MKTSYRLVERCNLPGTAAKDCNFLSPTLPDDILFEILIRLPVRVLLQFKSVCKSWKTLISSPQFATDNFRQLFLEDLHLNSRLVYSNEQFYHPRVGFLPLQPLFRRPSTTTKVVSFDMSGVEGGVVIRGSCNGLLCLHNLRSGCLCLWNPCTTSASQWFPIGFLSFTSYGFGYDHVHDKYKLIVRLHRQLSTRISTFGANPCWTIGPNFPVCIVGMSGHVGKFLSGSGTLNWMVKVAGAAPQANEQKWVILSFDLANENFSQVFLPRLSPCCSDNYCYPQLQVLRNCLSFTIHHKNSVFDLWMMKDYGVQESWMMISRIEICSYENSYPLAPLSIWKNDLLLLIVSARRLVLRKSDDGLLYYPVIDNSSDAISNPMCSRGGIFRNCFVYHDSLISPPQCALPKFLARKVE